MPLLEWEGRPAPRAGDEPERVTLVTAFFRKSFEDVVVAQRDHVRLPDVFLDLNGHDARGGDIQLAASIAIELLGTSPSIGIRNLWVAPRRS